MYAMRTIAKKLIPFSLLFGFPLTLFSAEIVVQAGDSGTSSTGSWHGASSATMPYEGNRGRYAIAGGAAETYTFAPALPETTSYRVDVYNSCYSPRSHQVTHYIHHASGTATHVVEQDCQIDPFVGQWRTLGTYAFNAGTSGSLVIDTTGSNNRYVGATAVRFVTDLTTDPIAESPVDTPDIDPPANLPAFPGAEGFGASTIGGRGGQVVKVTNLNDSGPGSLREAVTAPPRHYLSGLDQYKYESREVYAERLDASGGKIIVFDVSGIINLESTLIISYPFLTIAGETSPGGILVTGHQTTLNAHDVIMRFMRFRVGSHRIADGADPERLDSLAILGAYWATNEVYNVIIDHSSFSWGVDETVSITGGVLNTTVQWSIVSEGLSHAGHPKGEHSKGLMISGKYVNPSSVSLLRNYVAHNTSRNPLMASPMDVDTVVDGRNNISYDWNGGSSPSIEGSTKVNWVHNYARAGLRSHDYSYEIRVGDETSDEPQLYVLGNIGSSRESQEDEQWNVGVSWRDILADEENLRTMTPWEMPSTSTYDMSADTAECILSAVGATAPIRDSVDTRVINDFIYGTGEIIDDVSFPDDFPVFEDKPAPEDSDNDGMADSWESNYGMTVGEDDSADDNDGNGYTNIEEYLHALAADSYTFDARCMSAEMQ